MSYIKAHRTLFTVIIITLFLIGIYLLSSNRHSHQTTDPVESTQITSLEQGESHQSKPLDESPATESESHDSIYNLELMQSNHIAPMDHPEQYTQINQVIDAVIAETQVDPSTVSVAYYNFISGDVYELNADQPRIIGSIYKMPLVAMILEQVRDQSLTLDSPILIDGNAINAAGEAGNTGTFSLDEVIQPSIIDSNNVTSWALINQLYGGWPGYVAALSNFVDTSSVGPNIYQDNYLTADIVLNILEKISTDPTYHYLIELMLASQPHQLFTAYVNEGMANKYGSIDDALADAGIFYENERPMYALVGLTENSVNAYEFLELLNLRVNEWARFQALIHH